jgi:hypothetical protein
MYSRYCSMDFVLEKVYLSAHHINIEASGAVQWKIGERP